MTENQFAHGTDGTQCMHVFDHTELETYLAAHVEKFDRLDQIEKFSDGQSNPTYRLTSGGKQYVLRAKPTGKLMKSAHQVDREFRVMQALAGTDVPVPKMLHLSGDDTPLGTMFFIMEMVNGRIFWDPALPEMAKPERAAIYDQMNAVLAALHSVDPVAVGLGDFGKPGNYFERQLARWSAQYKASETEDLADADWLIGWLNDHLVADDGASSIVHGDYRIDNMMFAMHSTNVVGLGTEHLGSSAGRSCLPMHALAFAACRAFSRTWWRRSCGKRSAVRRRLRRTILRTSRNQAT